MLEELHKLARQGQWAAVLEVILSIENSQRTLRVELWHIRALRALGRGEEANDLLRTIAQSAVSAPSEDVIEFAEELLQCNFFAELLPLIKILKHKQLPASCFLESGLHRERNHWNEALKALAPLKRLDPVWVQRASIAEGWIQLRRGWLGAARELLEPFSADRHPGTQKLLARLELATGNLDQASTRLSNLSERQPQDWEWPILLATAQAMQGVPLSDCLHLAREGLKRQPRQAEGWALVMRLYMALGDRELAHDAMLHSLSIKPWMDSATTPWIEQLLLKREYSAAKAQLKSFCRLGITPKRDAMALDILRVEGAKVRDLLALAKSLENQYPDELDVLRSIAAAYQACRRNDPAARLLEKILRHNPFDKAAQNNLASLYQARGDSDDALRLWQLLVANGDSTARINLAQTLTSRGDLNEAESLWKLIHSGESRPEPLVLRGLAELNARRGDLKNALDLIKTACAEEPKNAMNWLQYGRFLAEYEGSRSAVKIMEEAEKLVDAPIKIREALFVLLLEKVNPMELLARVRHWREADESESVYWLMEAKTLAQLYEWEQVERNLKHVSKIEPSLGGVELIRFYLGRGRVREALEWAKGWVLLDKTEIQRWAHLAEIHFFDGYPDRAIYAIDQALLQEPTRLSLVRQRVAVLQSIGKLDEAERSARTLWEAGGELAALSLWVDVLQRSGKLDEAVEVVRRVLDQRPGERALRLRLANQLRRAGRSDESLKVLESLHNDEPDSDLVVQAFVRALVSNRQLEYAKRILQDFCVKQPDRLDLQVSMAELALEQGLIDVARGSLTTLICRSPDLLNAWVLLARVEFRADRTDAEIEIWLRIADQFAPERWVSVGLEHWVRLGLELELQARLNTWRSSEPDSPKPWWAALRAAQRMRDFPIALDILKGIERRQGKTLATLSARAGVYSEQWRMTEALQSAKEAYHLFPSDTAALEQILNIQVKAGIWEEFDQHFQKLEQLLGDKRHAAYGNMFFNLNCHPTWSSSQLFSLYRKWDERNRGPSLAKGRWSGKRTEAERKLRIGYVSPDFRGHVVAKFALPILMNHDRASFELFAYAHLERGQEDGYTKMFQQCFDQWHNISNMGITELEHLIFDHDIDILVDLAGHTSNNKLAVFRQSPAPILASHVIGAGQTTGISNLDYLIANADIWPPQFDSCASEKVERLPVSGLVFRVPEDALAPVTVPCNEKGFVTFGVFARPLRTNRRTIKVWAEILHQVSDSRLRFDHAPYLEPDIQNRFIDQFTEHGISADRLEFKNTRPYWTAFQQIDIQLDPFPAGSGTTATEGLYMERLVVTLRDRPAMGRIAHAQLVALKLDDICSAADEQEYVQKAVALASDPLRLAELSSGLRQRFENSPITDYKRYANALAATYRRWWKTWCEQQAQYELTQ